MTKTLPSQQQDRLYRTLTSLMNDQPRDIAKMLWSKYNVENVRRAFYPFEDLFDFYVCEAVDNYIRERP